MLRMQGRERRMKYYIGIDLGGTFIKYGLVSEGGEIVEESGV